MSKHMDLRRIMGKEQFRTLSDGRNIYLMKIEKRIGKIPVVFCKLDGKFRDFEVTDPIINQVIEEFGS